MGYFFFPFHLSSFQINWYKTPLPCAPCKCRGASGREGGWSQQGSGASALAGIRPGADAQSPHPPSGGQEQRKEGPSPWRHGRSAILAQLRTAELLEQWGGGTPGRHPQHRPPPQSASTPRSTWVGQGQLPGRTPSRPSGPERPSSPEPSSRRQERQRGERRSPPGAVYL